MARAVGLANPENAAKSQGVPFKEGVVRIDSNSYKVHKGVGDGDIVPATKWSWICTRMNESGDEPLLDDESKPITEELLFSFGGKSLPFVHPGQAGSPTDDPEDLGTSEKTEGNTVFLQASDWTPNEKSGIIALTRSLAHLEVSKEFLNRCWAPDWVGCIFEMRSMQGDKGADGRTFSYKVAHRVIQGPGGKTKAGKSVNGKVSDAEGYLTPILMALSEELDGKQITRKAFTNRVREALAAQKVDSKLLLPVLQLCKDDEWLNKHAETFDFRLNLPENAIIFGNLSA